MGRIRDKRGRFKKKDLTDSPVELKLDREGRRVMRFKEFEQSRRPPLLAWSVHVIVCGMYVGAYKFATEAEARADAVDRRRKFGVLGCRYIVEANEKINSQKKVS